MKNAIFQDVMQCSPVISVALFDACFLLVSCPAYCTTLQMDEAYSSKISVNFYQTIWRHIPEESSVRTSNPT
jgi:hypothetical protein